MDYILPSSVKSKLLRFALAKTGFLDTDALDLDKLNFSIGRNSNAEFRDVGLRLEKIAALLQLPPSIRLLAARAVLVRVTIAGDLSIAAEIDGIELRARIEESDDTKEYERSSESQKTPQHRKTARRIPKTPLHDTGGHVRYDEEESHLPTTQDLAKSFVKEETIEERQELEAAILSQSKNIDESVFSETSDEGGLGTGNALGLPTFLAGILKGIVDRLQVKVSNVNIRCDAELPSQATCPSDVRRPVSIALNIASIKVDPVTSADPVSGSSSSDSSTYVGRRRITFEDFSLDMLCDASPRLAASAPSSPAVPAQPFRTQSSATTQASTQSDATIATYPDHLPATVLPTLRGEAASSHGSEPSTPTREALMSHSPHSIGTPGFSPVSGADRFKDADEHDDDDNDNNDNNGNNENDSLSMADSSEIRAGEDSHSYTSRRSQASSDQSQAYNDMAQSQVLSASMLEFRSASGYLSEGLGHPLPSSETEISKVMPNSVSEFGDECLTSSSHSPTHGDDVIESRPCSPQSDEQSSAEMTESRMWSSEAGTSMYMSATGDESPPLPDYPGRYRVPGGFSDESYDESLSTSTPTLRSVGGTSVGEPEDKALTPRGFQSFADISPANSPPYDPEQATSAGSGPGQVRKRLLTLDTIVVRLPANGTSITQDDSVSRSTVFDPSPQNSASASVFGRNMPGTFSNYADLGASRRLQSSYIQDQPSVPDLGTKRSSSAAALDIDLSVLSIQADTVALRSLHQLTRLIEPTATSAKSSQEKNSRQTKQSNLPRLTLRLGLLRLAFLERVEEVPSHSTITPLPMELKLQPALVRVTGRDITFGLTPTSTVPDIMFAIRRLTAGPDNKDFFYFPKLGSAQHGKVDAPDVLIKVQRSQVTLQNKPIVDVRAYLRPMYLDFDLPAIDQALGSFGGLSGVVELSASMLSNSSDQADVPPSPQRRGVRFSEDAKPPADPTDTPEVKININLQGASIGLKSDSCSLELQCSALKLNARHNYVLVTMGSVKFSERAGAGQKSAPRFTIQFKDLKLEHLLAPDDNDLERLLSLITPSKNKYENDDDILLDTLIRQRRKGPILRVKIVSVQATVKCWSFLSDLKSLGQVLSKLSAVAKYLPEDDRPGLLVLPRITDMNARLPVNDHFGMLEISCRDIQMAQIGLPALVALSIGSICAGPLDGLDLVHELVRPAEQLPMIMMRMIGDEIEPTIKVKLFNLCVEYSVSTLVALSGSGAPMETENAVNNMATSILNLAAVEIEETLCSPSSESRASARPARKMGVEVLLRDCAIGLKPQDSSAKGVFVLADTKLSTVVPPEDVFSATLSLRKASLHIVDKELDSTQATEVALRSVPTTDRVSSHLAAKGFVSVSSIMKAQVIMNIIEDRNENTRSVDVEVRDELFLLETCADSTQTLISILNGLSPPTPPDNEPKFRTETMTVDDMMASFSGDAFEKDATIRSTIFDADDTPPSSEMEAPLQESIMSNSDYGPLEQDESLDLAEGDQFAESFLEDEDYLEIPDSSASRHMSTDDLWESAQRQCRQQSGGDAIQPRPFHFSDQQIDKAQSMVLGAQYRFNTPATPFNASKMTQHIEAFPLQFRVRDVHLIWNLYDGYDWEETRNTISEAVEEVEQKLEERKQRRRRSAEPEDEEESVIGDCLFNSIYIGVSSNREAGDIRRQISRGIDDLASESESYATSGTSRPSQYATGRQGRQPTLKKKLRLARSKAHKIAFELKGVSIDFSLHPPSSGEVQSSIDVRLQDFEIFDNIPTSTWRKFLTYYHDEENMRELRKPMIHIEMLTLRPVAELTATELSLRVSVLPLRLHVDQDALDFITRFFEFKPKSATLAAPSDPPFIQRIEVNTVLLSLDYKPKKVDYGGIRSGHAGEFKNFVILDRAAIKLKHVIVYGVKGFDALHPTLSDIWTPDVIKNQLPGVLAGLAPLRSFVSLGAGVRDIVAIPVREYKKDGRLVRSVQKGAFHFARNTTAELARLGAKIAVGTQTVLTGFEETLGRAHERASVEGDEREDRRLVSNYADQPLGVLQGIVSGRRQLERDLLTAKDAFIAVQGEMVDAGSAAGAAQAFARHAPTIILRPVIGASRAVGQTLMGVGNQVDRANVRRNEDKYKSR